MEEEIQQKKLENEAKLKQLEKARQAKQRLEEIQARLNRKRANGERSPTQEESTTRAEPSENVARLHGQAPMIVDSSSETAQQPRSPTSEPPGAMQRMGRAPGSPVEQETATETRPPDSRTLRGESGPTISAGQSRLPEAIPRQPEVIQQQSERTQEIRNMEEEIQQKKLENEAKLEQLEKARQAKQRLKEIQARLNRKMASGAGSPTQRESTTRAESAENVTRLHGQKPMIVDSSSETTSSQQRRSPTSETPGAMQRMGRAPGSPVELETERKTARETRPPDSRRSR